MSGYIFRDYDDWKLDTGERDPIDYCDECGRKVDLDVDEFYELSPGFFVCESCFEKLKDPTEEAED